MHSSNPYRAANRSVIFINNSLLCYSNTIQLFTIILVLNICAILKNGKTKSNQIVQSGNLGFLRSNSFPPNSRTFQYEGSSFYVLFVFECFYSFLSTAFHNKEESLFLFNFGF